MISLTPTETLPLEIDADGVVRVGKTRVSLDTVILALPTGRLPKRSLSSIRPCSSPISIP